MLSLHTNAAALSAQNSVGATQKNLSTSMSRLSTGYRINSAMDDAAGLQIASRLKAQTSGMAVAMRNTQNGISMMQTAEGAFNEVTSVLTRMKDLATQSADASSSKDDQVAMQAEYDALGKEMMNIMQNTSFGGEKLLAGTASAAGVGKLIAPVTFQIGASKGETMALDASTVLTTLEGKLTSASKQYKTDGSAGAAGTEIGGGATAAANATSANAIIDTLSQAIDAVGAVRSVLGAGANRLDHVYNNLANMSSNVTQATSRIMDVDYATETANMTSKQMLMQAGTSMLKQSGSMSQLVMSLMQ